MMPETWWWGTFPSEGADTPTGRGEGVWAMTPGGPAFLALELPAPSFVATHPDLPLLYAVTNEERSTLACIDVEDVERPVLVDRIPTGGSEASHLLLAPDTLTAYVSHYGSGELAVVPLGADGRIATPGPAQVFPGSGSGPVPRRQAGPRAHFAGYAPEGFVVLVADFGADVLRRYDAAPDGTLRDGGIAAALPPGSGPRHFALHEDCLYITCELDHTVKTFRWDAARSEALLVDSTPSTTAPLRSGDTIYEAHALAVGAVLLVSVRGCDVISVFDLGGDGIPTLRASFDSGGTYPRHFAVTGEKLVVGNETSHVASVFDLADVLGLDAENEPGAIAELRHASFAIPSPACVAFD